MKVDHKCSKKGILLIELCCKHLSTKVDTRHEWVRLLSLDIHSLIYIFLRNFIVNVIISYPVEVMELTRAYLNTTQSHLAGNSVETGATD